MTDVILFAGTTEGRKLSSFLSRHNVSVTACVATEYGTKLMEKSENLEVLSQRLNASQITDLIKSKKCSVVVDATHPYASEVTKNILKAVEDTGVQYLRLIRKPSGEIKPGCVYVNSPEEAAEFLKDNPMKTLLTIGSKELKYFAHLEGLSQKMVARVLPMPEVLDVCKSLGFQGKQLICMQGPFGHELNVAMIKELHIECLVTKDSGDVGGFYEKISAAEETGIVLVVIGRPTVETGSTYAEVKAYLSEKFQINTKNPKGPNSTIRKMFPVFLSLSEKQVLVVGGGKVAQRRIRAMLDYGGKVTLLSPNVTDWLQEQIDLKRVTYLKRPYDPSVLQGFDIVIAATDNREINRQIGQRAKKAKLLVNVADKKEESNFYFSALVQGEKLTAGIISADGDHKRVKEAAERLRKVWNHFEENS